MRVSRGATLEGQDQADSDLADSAISRASWDMLLMNLSMYNYVCAHICIMFHHVNPHNSTHHRRRNSVYMPYTSHNEAEPFLCFHSTWIHVTTGLTQDYPVQFAYLRLLGH